MFRGSFAARTAPCAAVILRIPSAASGAARGSRRAVATIERRFPKTVLMDAKSADPGPTGLPPPRLSFQEKAASLLGARFCQLKLPTVRSSCLSALFRHARAPTGSAPMGWSFRVSRKALVIARHATGAAAVLPAARSQPRPTGGQGARHNGDGRLILETGATAITKPAGAQSWDVAIDQASLKIHPRLS